MPFAPSLDCFVPGMHNKDILAAMVSRLIAAAWKGWTVISAVMGGVGLYWLSAEYLNWLSAEYLNPDQRPEN